MDRDRLKLSEKLYNLKQASQKLGVSIDTLQYLSERYAVVPVIDSKGQFWYNLQDLQTLLSRNASRNPSNVHAENPIGQSSAFPGNKRLRTGFGGLVEWVGGWFAEHEREKKNLSSDLKLFIEFSSLKPTKKKTVYGLAVIALLMLGMVIVEASGLTKPKRDELALTVPEDQGEVLAASTSKVKLTGSIVFALPVDSKEKVTVRDDVLVEGESVFIGNITAPNVLYGIVAGDNVTLSGEGQNPTISVDIPTTVTSLQGEIGPIELLAGTDIGIDGLTISNLSTLATVVSRGTCSGCVTDSSVVNTLTIDAGGTINAEAVKSGILATTVGGTGLTAYATGDILYASAADTLEVLPIGSTDGQVLQVQGGIPAWSSIALDAAGTDSLTSGANLIGVFDNLVSSSSNNLQQVLKDLDSSITVAGVSPFTIATNAPNPNMIIATDSTHDFALGGATQAGSTLFFDSSAANLSLGTNNVGSGGLDGRLTLFSSGNGITDPYIEASPSGDLLIPNGNLGISAIPSGQFSLEVGGHIGPSADAIYDLGSSTRRYRNLYLSGTTTSDGDITISNADPQLRFEDTTASQDDFTISVNNSTFTLQNDTLVRNELTIDSLGDWTIAGGSGSTGCTIENSTGNLTCTGDIQTTSGAIEANGGSITSTATTLTISGGTNIALTSDFDSSVFIGNATTPAPLSVSGGIGGNAAFIVNQTNTGDIINASASGTTRFRVANTGELILGDDTSSFFGTLDLATLTADRTFTLPDAAGTFCLQGSINCGFAFGTNYLQLNSNLLSPINSTYDFAVGGTSTDSAKFAVINIAGGTPTATISANSGNNSVYLTGAGNLGTTNAQTLTLGGSTTGDIVIDAGSGTLQLADNSLLFTGSTPVISSTNTLTINAFTLGGQITAAANNITNTGTLDFGTNNISINGTTISTAGGNSGLTLTPNGTGDIYLSSDDQSGVFIGNATTPAPLSISGGIGGNAALVVNQINSGDILSASASGTTVFTLQNNGNIQFYGGQSIPVILTSAATGSQTITLPDESGTICVQGSTSCGFSIGQNYWQLNTNLLAPSNSTYDFAVGGTSTNSAKFAVINISGGTPTATISAGTGNIAAYLTGSGNLGTTNSQTLTIGGSTTGDIVLSGRNSANNSITFSGYGAGALQSDAAGRITSGTLPVSLGGTGITSYTQGDILVGNGSNTLSALAVGAEGSVLSVVGGAPAWLSNSSLNFWQRNEGALSPYYLSDDFLIGGPSTSSAQFAITGISTGTPIASLSATTNNNGLAFNAANSSIQSLRSNTLTLGGTTTGDIILSGRNAANDGIVFSGYGVGVLHSDATGRLTSSAVNLSSEVVGILPTANGGSPFEVGSGSIYERITTQDFLLGGTSTASAKFAFVNVAGGTPTATISANSGNIATYISGSGNLGTTNSQTLTLGGTTTGDVIISGRNGSNTGVILSGYGAGAIQSDATGRLTS
ncbi:MAG: MerR family transcriptional regulator, partial [Candidatus Levybacteria bacterium]|nr:MerR family transcriptional regulator [Candidatus Levybacteria bacterium]